MRIYKVIQEFPNLYKGQFLFEEKGIFTDADNHIVSNTFLNFKQSPKFLTEITKYLKVGKAIFMILNELILDLFLCQEV